MKEYPDGEWDNQMVFRKTKLINLEASYLSEEFPRLLFAALTARKDISPVTWEEMKQKGKIAAHEIYVTVVDGAAEVASNGYVDINDLPPVDTWIYQAYRIGKGYPVLYCWVPNAFVADVQAAMDVHVLDNYEWIDVEQLLPDYQQ
ncbi:hypothetical protein [Chitinophaga varians]|uniref:hypothetical protein n=1 Tax=Chitinophaga varians TaxID=2202339 RepID=UPI00165F6684|nr:hypothetical protein [Chitinophaga varians]MBC9909308.1 hypothetical protein [Chitinophaga varians]